MLNNIFLVGKFVGNCTYDDSVDEHAPYKVHMVCEDVETDVFVWDGIVKPIAEKADNAIAVGLKGCVKSVNGQLKVIAQRISFLQEAGKND